MYIYMYMKMYQECMMLGGVKVLNVIKSMCVASLACIRAKGMRMCF